jgi:hypothetical protein
MKPIVAALVAFLSAGAAASAAEPTDFAAYTPRATAVRISHDEAPKIDGDLSDPAWAKAVPITEFYQVEPVEGVAPSQATRAYILYDDTAIYVGPYLYDTDPERIARDQLVRDAEMQDEDAIRIYLDPFGTFRNAYFFSTNANGAKVDSLIENNAAFKKEWNTIFDVKTSTTADGWIAEFEIPFQSIAIDPNLKDWNFQILRTIRRTNEEIRWSNIDRSRGRIDLTNPGRLTGIEGVKSGIGLEAQLFATGATSYDWETGDTDTTFDPSANIFYKITPSLTGSLTLNTDFADAPLDARQVNTGRFNLFFPETRDFVLQDAASFEFGGRVFQDNVNGLPFFSRNLGIVEGRPVDLVAGAKVSGKLGPANLGVLAVKTGDDEIYGGQYLGSARASFNVLNESKAGLVFTHGDPTGLADNTVGGVDFQYKNSTRFPGTLFADFDYLRSFDNNGGINLSDQFASSDIAYRSEKWNWTSRFRHVGADYQPRLGFVNRTGIREYNQNFFRVIRPDNSPIRRIETGLFALAVTDLGDELLDRELGGFFHVESQIGDSADVEVFRGFLDIRDTFDIAGRLNVPVAEYKFTRYRIQLQSSQARTVAAGVEYRWGGVYGGDFRQWNTNAAFRPNRYFNISAEYSLTQFDLPTGYLAVHVGAIASTIAFSPTMFVTTDIQYDNISEAFTALTRFSWEPTPEREIFISLGHTALIEEDRFPQSFRAQGTGLAVRLGHTFRM